MNTSIFPFFHLSIFVDWIKVDNNIWKWIRLVNLKKNPLIYQVRLVRLMHTIFLELNSLQDHELDLTISINANLDKIFNTF